MKLKKSNYKKLMLNENSSVKRTTIHSVENNTCNDKVTITPKQVKKTMKFFSKLNKEK